jgi:hypothetical protein
MLFVDESGDPGYPSNGNWQTFGGSALFTRVGVIIHGWKWRAWNDRFLQFKHRNGLAWDDEIKASNIRKGHGCFVGWDEHRRNKFLIDLAALVGLNTDITLIGIAIDKRKVNTSQRERLVKPQIRSMELLLERFNMFLGLQKDKAGIVVLDPTKEKNDDNIRYFQSYLQSHSPNLNPSNIVESTFFAKSHTSNMVQISDVCTNVFYRESLHRNKEQPYKEIFPRFYRYKGKLLGCGIKWWP